ALMEQFVKGLLDWGVDVVDIGEITTDMLYFAAGRYGYSGGAVVSASHNPGQYNGFKLVKEGAAAISSDTGLYDIRDILKANPDMKPSKRTRGKRSTRNIIDDYLEHVLSFVDTGKIKPFKIVANGNFGYVGRNVDKIAKKLNLDLIRLNFEPDGSFPKGPPNPMLKENSAEAEEMIRTNTVDFGAAWDADADRIMFFDEKGNSIPGIYITALLAEIMLHKEKGAKIIFDPRVVWPAFDAVARNGGKAIMAKAGHAFMKDRMRAENAIFAGELSAHYYFRDNYYADNGIIPFLLVLEYLSITGKPFSEIVAPFMANHYTSGELNHKVKDCKVVLDKVQSLFSSRGKEDFTDGYAVEGDNWRFNLRASNTEPLLRLNVESRDPKILKKMTAELEKIILE
ncbi:MAG: phosphomannomutase/phosphoglucomutase, partial [Planctomycetota bacterium]